MATVQAPAIPMVADLIRATPGTISLGQGVVAYGPPPQAVNRCGNDPSGLAYSGRSQILDPRGMVVADAGSGEGVFRASVDPESQRRYRQEFPALRDIRIRGRIDLMIGSYSLTANEHGVMSRNSTL